MSWKVIQPSRGVWLNNGQTGEKAGLEQSMLTFWFHCRSDVIPAKLLRNFPGRLYHCEAANIRKIQPSGLPKMGIQYLI
jgi:hypothetical protein